MSEEFLKRGFYVELIKTSGEPPIVYEVQAVEPFKYRTGDGTTAEFSMYAPQTSTGYKNISNLEPSEIPPRLYQVRWGIATPGKYHIKVPTGTNRMGTDQEKEVGYLTMKENPWFAPDPDYEFWLLHDYYPSVEYSNVCAYTMTPGIIFYGMKYDIKKVTDSTILAGIKAHTTPAKRIAIGGVAT